MIPDLEFLVAAKVHTVWANWMNYLFMKCKPNDDGSLTIPKWAVERWRRQSMTGYDYLEHEERKSDIELAQEYISLIEGYNDK